MVKLYSILGSILFLLFGCSDTKNKPLSIVFSADSTALELNHIDPAGLLKLKNENNRDSLLKSLVTVVEAPEDTDTAYQEIPLPGRVMLTDSNIVFIPEHSFVKGTAYLVITYLNVRFGDLEKVLKGGLNPGVRPRQQRLVR
ncbi:hypothetical protein PBAL39_10496 [Pedobacter sp. BAL39]|uniref:hypothetical protein n=1 Tax=Pedobacter sp. BAL39 TaxID=391596 RepID=UPI00015596FA|nr:hypothetical protein [Pedobacter sp. BAL39]EDM37567.1 hypothetical protein PBAL39_10496 [Pedobacter sp. BAL39]